MKKSDYPTFPSIFEDLFRPARFLNDFNFMRFPEDSLNPSDMWEDGNTIYVKVSVPGIDKDKLDISVSDDSITVKGETKEEHEEKNEKNKKYYYKNISYKNFYETIDLPVSIDPEKVDAKYENGELIISAPKVEQEKSKRINVK